MWGAGMTCAEYNDGGRGGKVALNRDMEILVLFLTLGTPCQVKPNPTAAILT